MSTGILLVNLGTPSAPTRSAVAKYLREFLLDPHVIQRPWWFRYLLVCGLIVPFRAGKSAKAYQAIWTEQGSPLLVYSQQLQQALQERLGSETPVALGMRYGNPSIASALQSLKEHGVTDVKVIPLYPQATQSSTLTATEKVCEEATKLGLRTAVVPPFYDHPEFIEAHRLLLSAALADADYDRVLFSFHGIPEEHLLAVTPDCKPCLREATCPETCVKRAETDCYRWQCYQTARGIAAACGLSGDQFIVGFQSRLGRLPWIEPATDTLLDEMAAKGDKKILVLCPAFTADCLETLEEMGMANRERFLSQGGVQYDLLPCLNASPGWVNALANLI